MAANGKLKDEFRALPRGYELRDGDEMPTLVGHLAVFNEWAEINSAAEGHFLERIAPGAFNKTISENRDKMRVLFQHGKDPQIGEKPLGPIQSLEADERGVAYEVPLLDTTYNRDLLPGLEAGLYGSSFRFQVIDQHRDRRPGKAAHNPQGLPERTVKEVRMPEFGPVVFPAYWGAKSGLRSLTDRFERADTEDLSTLAQMIQLASEYIEEQDDPGDEANVPKMEAVLQVLVALSQYEVTEDELPDEPEDEEEMASTDKRTVDDNAPRADRAGSSHPIRAGREKAVPLYAGKKGVEPRWRL